MRVRYVPAMLTLLLSACSGAGILNAVAPTGEIAIVRDVPYAAGERHVLDIYRPRADNAPVVVFVYGGGWRSGDKATYRFAGAALAARGLLTVIPDYRTYPQAAFPGFVEDAAAAVAWAKAHASEYGGDPGRVFLIGHSAGAHIAAMLTLDAQWLNTVGLDPRRDLAGFVGIAGPYDFLPLESETLKIIFGPSEQLARTQPINFVMGGEPPTLLITGGFDLSVDPRNSERLAAKIESLGGHADVIKYPMIGHALVLGVVARPLRFIAPTLRDTSAFIESLSPVSHRSAVKPEAP